MDQPSFRDKASNFFRSFSDKINEAVISHRTFVDVALEIAKGASQYFIWKSPASLIEGAFSALKSVGSASYYPKDLFSENNGWFLLSYQNTNIGNIFVPVLEKYPAQNLKFTNYERATVQTIELPIGKIGMVSIGEEPYNNTNIFYRPDQIKGDDLRKFLIDEFIRMLDTKCFSVADGARSYYNTNISIVAEKLTSIHSKKTDEYVSYIKDCLSKDINRSLLFYGPPGSGKSNLASSIMKELDFRTLKFRYALGFDFNIFRFVIEAFGIEAVIIDDFDQAGEAGGVLEFLEFLKKAPGMKVVIAIANTLKTFHPAILRCDRVDEIIKIDTIETETIKSLLGKLYKTYGARVKKWPVAYVQELSRRDQIGKQPLEKAFEELDKRVKDQIKKLKE